MPATAMAQINARLPRELKAEGDAGLAVLGLSPTEAIRRLWQCLSGREEDFDLAKKLLVGPNSETKDKETDSFARSALFEGWQLVDAYTARLGLSMRPQDSERSDMSDADLLAQALEKRMAERELS